MIRVLGLALYGQLAASTRYRLAQFVPGLAEHGIELQVQSLLGDEYLRRRFHGGRTPLAAMIGEGWKRLGDLNDSAHDLALLHCELYPLMPGWLERALLRSKPYIYDFDDAFYLKYRRGKLGFLRPLLGRKFDGVIRDAAAVTAGSRTLQHYASVLNPRSTVFPTVVDTDRYVPSKRRSARSFTVGWIGSPSTAPYLKELVEPLAKLAKEGPVRFVVIGGKAPNIPGVDLVEVAWTEASEVELINGFDVGVMPLPDDDWARGKCAFKLIQYMACGIPVVASPVGANNDVVQDGCGLLAADGEQWLEAFRTIRDDRMLASRMGAVGRERAVRLYSLRRNIPVLVEVIRTSVAEGRARCAA